MPFWRRSSDLDTEKQDGVAQKPRKGSEKVQVPTIFGLLGVLSGVALTAYFDLSTASRIAEIQTHAQHAAAAYADFLAADAASRFERGAVSETTSSWARITVFGDTTLVAAVAQYACKPSSTIVGPNDGLLEVVPHMRRHLSQDSVKQEYLEVLLVRPTIRGSPGDKQRQERCEAILADTGVAPQADY